MRDAGPIFSLQTMLRQISYADSNVLPVIPDGTYGRNTYASVRSFQAAHNLPETGVADRTTWDSIVQVHNDVLCELCAPVIAPIWQTGQRVHRGGRNTHLLLVQAMLLALARHFSGLRSPRLTGILDDDTAQALVWLQSCCGLPETGTLDAPTWHNLAKLYRVTIGDGTVTTAETAAWG